MQLPSRLLSIPLAKYSRAVDVSRDVEQFTWTHIQHDLVVVIDNYYRAEGGHTQANQHLRVLHGTQVLEDIPVQEMIANAEEVIRTMMQLRVQVKNEQLPISALTRRPLFALRYNLNDDKIRRIQLKFLSGEDFDRCYNHLRGLGLRMSTSGERPSTASVSTTASTASSSGPSCPPARLAEFNNRPNTSLGAVQSCYISSTVPKVSSPLARNPSTLASHGRETLTSNRPVSATRPSTANSLLHQASTTYSAQSPLEPPEYFPRPDSSSSNLDRPFSSSSNPRESLSAFSTVGDLPPFPTVPSTSTMLSTHRQSSEANLPPRRELPFARATPPKSAGSDCVRPGSRGSNVSMAPPPLPPPSRLPRSASSLGHTPGVDPSDSLLHQAVRSSDAQEQRMSTPQSFSKYGFDTNLPPLPRPTFIDNVAKTARTNSSPPSYNVSPPGRRMSMQPLQSSPSDAQNVRSPTFRTAAPAAAKGETTYQGRIVSELTEQFNENARDSLAAYAEKTDEERRDILDKFIWDHIRDENFMVLAEDMSQCWAKVGLGL